jgi:hypothetical protein
MVLGNAFSNCNSSSETLMAAGPRYVASAWIPQKTPLPEVPSLLHGQIT